MFTEIKKAAISAAFDSYVIGLLNDVWSKKT